MKLKLKQTNKQKKSTTKQNPTNLGYQFEFHPDPVLTHVANTVKNTVSLIHSNWLEKLCGCSGSHTKSYHRQAPGMAPKQVAALETFACLTCGSLNCIHPRQNQQIVRVRAFTARLAVGGMETGERRRSWSQNSAEPAAASAAPTGTFPSGSFNL